MERDEKCNSTGSQKQNLSSPRRGIERETSTSDSRGEAANVLTPASSVTGRDSDHYTTGELRYFWGELHLYHVSVYIRRVEYFPVSRKSYVVASHATRRFLKMDDGACPDTHTSDAEYKNQRPNQPFLAYFFLVELSSYTPGVLNATS